MACEKDLVTRFIKRILFYGFYEIDIKTGFYKMVHEMVRYF